MKFSIITPSYNQGRFIEDAIKSVLAQDHPSVEHIIVDNCSNDETKAVLDRYPHLKVISEPDDGQSEALNKGFHLAKGEYVGWLNADDRYLPGYFHQVERYFIDNRNTDIVYADYYLVDEKGNLIKKIKELPYDAFSLRYLHVLCIPSTTVFLKQKIFKKDYFLNTAYHYAMDYEYFLRLTLGGYRFAHIKTFGACFRWYTDSKSAQFTREQTLELLTASYANDPLLQRMGILKGFVRFFLMIIARGKRVGLKAVHGCYKKV